MRLAGIRCALIGETTVAGVFLAENELPPLPKVLDIVLILVPESFCELACDIFVMFDTFNVLFADFACDIFTLFAKLKESTEYLRSGGREFTFGEQTDGVSVDILRCGIVPNVWEHTELTGALLLSPPPELTVWRMFS